MNGPNKTGAEGEEDPPTHCTVSRGAQLNQVSGRKPNCEQTSGGHDWGYSVEVIYKNSNKAYDSQG